MTRLRRMSVVDAWLSSDQSMMGFARDQGVDLCELLGWLMEYAQPAAPSTWIPVRILDGCIDNPQLNRGDSDYYPKPDISLPRVFGAHWVPVVIQERT
jgi:hypothetical protein